MSFQAKLATVGPIVIGLPFIVILLMIQSAAEDCKDSIVQGLPDAVKGNMHSIDDSQKTYCDPNTGQFQEAKKLADITTIFYPYYIWPALILTFVIAGIWESWSG